MSQFSQEIARSKSLGQKGQSPTAKAVKPVLGEAAIVEAMKPGSEIPPRVVILTAIAEEFLAVEKYVPERREIEHPDGTVYEYGQFTSDGAVWDVAIGETGQGNRRAGTETQRAIAYFKPDVVLFVGVAGGRKDVEIGDVVAAEKVYNYESGRDEIDFKPRPEVERPSYGLEQRARAVRRDWLRRREADSTKDFPRAFVGAIAAGESVVASTESGTAQRLNQTYGDALAVEKEGYGFLAAAREIQGSVSALVIRGISDLLDGKEAADKRGSQKLAARHASEFAFELLAKLGGSELKKDSAEPFRGDRVNIALDEKPPSAIAILRFWQYEDSYSLQAYHGAMTAFEETTKEMTLPITLGKLGTDYPWKLDTVGELEDYQPQKCPIGRLLKWIRYLQRHEPAFSCLAIEEQQNSIVPWELLNLGDRPLGVALQTVRSHLMPEDGAININTQTVRGAGCCCQGEVMVYVPTTQPERIASHCSGFQSYVHNWFSHQDPEQVFVHLQKMERQVGLVMIANLALRQVTRGRRTAYLKRTKVLKKFASVVILQLLAGEDGKSGERELATAFLEHGARGVLGMLENVDGAIAQQITNDFFAEYRRNTSLPIPEILRQLRKAIAQRLNDELTDEMAKLYLATFLYAYYGHPMTTLQLTRANP